MQKMKAGSLANLIKMAGRLELSKATRRDCPAADSIRRRKNIGVESGLLNGFFKISPEMKCETTLCRP
jgi:hypothetical protein